MTSVLLISDTEKVQRLFASLEKKGLFQLRIAATLTQGDQEIAGSAPDYTFVQSRISGFSGLIMLRHLKKALPKQAKVVLLAGDPDDAEQARQGAIPFLDLTVEDEALAEQIRELMQGAGRPARQKVAAPKQVDFGKITPKAKKGAPAPLDAAPASAAAEKAKKEKPVVPEASPARPVPERKELGSASAKKAPQSSTAELEAPPLMERSVLWAAKGASLSFEEVMRQASAKTGAAPSQVKDRVHFGKPAPKPGPAPESQVSPDREGVSEAGPGEVYRGEPLEEAMLRAEKKKQSGWIIALAVALVFILLAVFYLIGRKPTAPPSPAQPAQKTGLRTLPPIVQGLRLDPEYDKPGGPAAEVGDEAGVRGAVQERGSRVQAVRA